MNPAPPRPRANTRLRRAVIAASVIVMLAAAWSHRFGHTPAFQNAAGGSLSGSIAEIRRVRLGGVEQSVLIRGRRAHDPVLIWLHGGPGMDELGMLRHYNAALEDHFLVVYWTQRGTGRSYDPAAPTSALQLARFVTDLHELVGQVQHRFGHRRVVLAAHSWGTAIGTAYAQAYPGDVAAYVGIGQITDEAENERRSYRWTLAAARHAGDAGAVRELTAIGPPPYDVAALLTERRWLDHFGGVWFRPTPFVNVVVTSFRAPEATWYDLVTFGPGKAASLEALWSAMLRIDIARDTPALHVPVFLMMGRRDHNTDGALAYEWYEALRAPRKSFTWFERSAHSPPFEQPETFNTVMIRDVLPVASRAAS